MQTESFVPEQDVLGTHDNGSKFVVAPAGIAISLVDAERLGLLAAKAPKAKAEQSAVKRPPKKDEE